VSPLVTPGRKENAAGEVDSDAPALPAVQRERLDGLFAAMTLVARDWPWPARDDVCVLLIAADAQWGLNCSDAPMGQFSRTADFFRGKPVFARRGTRYRSGGRELTTAELLHAMSAAAHVDEPGARRSDLAPGHPWLVLGSIEGLRANHVAFEECSTEEWISVALHEFAHTRQLTMPGFESQLRAINSGALSPASLSGLYTSNAEYRRFVDAEYAHLIASAWAAPDAARTALARWLGQYEARHAWLAKQVNGATLIRADTLFTYIEGAARFAESWFLVDASQHPTDVLKSDPLSRGYDRFSGRGYAGMPNKQMDADYFYAIGFHLCVLLERIDPGWKSRVHADPDYIFGQVRAVLRATRP
jgi:hypothetical protein